MFCEGLRENYANSVVARWFYGSRRIWKMSTRITWLYECKVERMLRGSRKEEDMRYQ